jgi:hypothetical protein
LNPDVVPDRQNFSHSAFLFIPYAVRRFPQAQCSRLHGYIVYSLWSRDNICCSSACSEIAATKIHLRVLIITGY